jgi:hypothetical protein
MVDVLYKRAMQCLADIALAVHWQCKALPHCRPRFKSGQCLSVDLGGFSVYIIQKPGCVIKMTGPVTVLPQLRPLVTNMRLYAGCIWPSQMQQTSYMSLKGEADLGNAQLAVSLVPHMASSILLQVCRVA